MAEFGELEDGEIWVTSVILIGLGVAMSETVRVRARERGMLLRLHLHGLKWCHKNETESFALPKWMDNKSLTLIKKSKFDSMDTECSSPQGMDDDFMVVLPFVA